MSDDKIQWGRMNYKLIHEKKQELERRIAYAKRQFLISQQYSMLSQASSITGACKTKRIYDGNNVEYTDDQKVKRELDTMHQHIHRMSEINDAINALQEELDNAPGNRARDQV